MKNSTQRPAAYLKDLSPAYELNLKVGSVHWKLLRDTQLGCHCTRLSTPAAAACSAHLCGQLKG